MVWPIRKKISAAQVLQQADIDEQKELLKAAISKLPEPEPILADDSEDETMEDESCEEQEVIVPVEPSMTEKLNEKVEFFFNLISSNKYDTMKSSNFAFNTLNFENDFDTHTVIYLNPKAMAEENVSLCSFLFNKFVTRDGEKHLVNQLHVSYEVSLRNSAVDTDSTSEAYWPDASYRNWVCLSMKISCYDKWKNCESSYLPIKEEDYAKHFKLIKIKIAQEKLKHIEAMCKKVL